MEKQSTQTKVIESVTQTASSKVKQTVTEQEQLRQRKTDFKLKAKSTVRIRTYKTVGKRNIPTGARVQ